jgi:hypothetical protein
MEVDSDISNLIDYFDYNTTIIWKPKHQFVKDIDYIIEELKSYNSFINLDIYEILVSCGHKLTWDQEYNLSNDDFNWFKINGRNYLLTALNQKVNDLYEYTAINSIHLKLTELFELQIEN